MSDLVLIYQGPRKNSDGQVTINYYEHEKAIRCPTDFARAMIRMLQGWEKYATTYAKRYECSIGGDAVIGTYWAETGLAIKRLLDGELNGLDAGSLAKNITDLIESQGFKTDGYNLIKRD